MYCLSLPQRRLCVTGRLGRELEEERQSVQRTVERERWERAPHTHRLFTASQRPSLANDFLISLFYHVYCNAQQEPLQRNELLCSLFTEDCDDALFF